LKYLLLIGIEPSSSQNGELQGWTLLSDQSVIEVLIKHWQICLYMVRFPNSAQTMISTRLIQLFQMGSRIRTLLSGYNPGLNYLKSFLNFYKHWCTWVGHHCSNASRNFQKWSLVSHKPEEDENHWFRQKGI
jgi:hypothetical protein